MGCLYTMFEFLSPSGIFEFDVIKFTKEEEENNKLAELDLELNVNWEEAKIVGRQRRL